MTEIARNTGNHPMMPRCNRRWKADNPRSIRDRRLHRRWHRAGQPVPARYRYVYGGLVVFRRLWCWWLRWIWDLHSKMKILRNEYSSRRTVASRRFDGSFRVGIRVVLTPNTPDLLIASRKEVIFGTRWRLWRWCWWRLLNVGNAGDDDLYWISWWQCRWPRLLRYCVLNNFFIILYGAVTNGAQFRWYNVASINKQYLCVCGGGGGGVLVETHSIKYTLTIHSH